MMDLESILDQLSSRRPIFHSEADFQHELAWEIHKVEPDLSLRLERPFPRRASGAIDLVAAGSDRLHGIELKYLTRSCQTTFAGEEFKLKQHGAQDIRRYDVCKDVRRMEDFCSTGPSSASVIVLTNDPYYWRSRERTGTCAEAFDIGEARQLSGLLNWADHTGLGTKKNREDPIDLRGSYRLGWRDYSDLNCPGGLFRYLLVHVGSEQQTPQS